MANGGDIVARLQLKVDDFRQGMQDAQGELTKFSGATQALAGAATAAFAAITTAVAGVGAAAFAMAVEQEAAMAKMQAATGATASEMEQFSEAADNLFAAGRGNYDEIYSTLTTLKQTLGLTGKEAEVAADKALIMSQTFGWDVTESVRAASTASKTFGTDSTQSFDTFTALAQQAGDKSGDLLDTFNEYAPIVSDMGLSFEDFGDILANGMDAGAFNFDKIGDALKEFNIRAQDGSKTTGDAFATLGMDAEVMGQKFAAGGEEGKLAFDQVLQGISQIKDPMKQNEVGVQLFGTMWEDLGSDVILSMGQAEGALKNVEGSVAGAGEALDSTFGAKVTTIKNEFLLWAKELGEQFLPKLKEIADVLIANMPAILAAVEPVFTAIGNAILTVVNVLITVVKFVNDNAVAFQALGAVITGVVLPALLGFLLNALRVKTQALIGLLVNTFKLIAANYALGMSFLAANLPLLLIIAGIIALIAVIVLIVKNWDTVKAVTIQVWEAIKSFLLSTWEWIKATFASLMTWLSNVWNTSWNAIKTFFTSIWNGIKSVATSIWNGLKAAFMAVFNGIKIYFQTVLLFYKTLFTTIWNGIKAVAVSIWNGLKAAVMLVFNAIKAYFVTILNFYRTLFTTIWNAIKNTTVSVFTAIKSKAVSIWNSIKSTLSSVVNNIRSIVTSVFNSLKSSVVNVWNTIRTSISNTINNIRTKVADGANFMRNKFTDAVSAVKGVFSGLWGSIRQSLTDVVEGIKSKVGEAKEWLTELNPFKRHSPSLVDNVLAGTKIIKDTYEGLGGMRIAPPQIGNLSSGRVDVNQAFGDVQGGGSGGGSNYNAPLVQVENMNVRDDRDVRNVSKELFNLQRNHDRAKGGR